MKKVLYLLLFLLLGCNQEDEQAKTLNNDLQIFFTENLQDSTSTLDSFRLVRIDPITNKLLLQRQSFELQKILENVANIYELKASVLQSLVTKGKTLAMMDLKENAKDAIKEFDREMKKSEIIKTEMDSLLSIITKMESKVPQTDSIKPIAYMAICKYQIRLKDRSIKQDTAYISLNKNKDIIKYSNLLNLPYTVDYGKFE